MGDRKIILGHNSEGLNVLSLCDGMSCGQIALRELHIPIAHYWSSEIDKTAISVTQSNFPDTIQKPLCNLP